MDVGEAQVPDTAKLQLLLLMRQGGMGLTKLALEVSRAVHSLCAAQTRTLLHEAAQPLQMFEGTRGEQLQGSAQVRARLTPCCTARSSKMQQRACGLKSSARTQMRS